MSTVQVAVEKAGKVIETVERPLREAKGGPAVMYRRHLWRLHEGRIEIDGTPLDDEADGPRQPRVNRPEPEAPPDDTAVRDRIAGASASARMLVDACPGPAWRRRTGVEPQATSCAVPVATERTAERADRAGSGGLRRGCREALRGAGALR